MTPSPAGTRSVACALNRVFSFPVWLSMSTTSPLSRPAQRFFPARYWIDGRDDRDLDAQRFVHIAAGGGRNRLRGRGAGFLFLAGGFSSGTPIGSSAAMNVSVP